MPTSRNLARLQLDRAGDRAFSKTTRRRFEVRGKIKGSGRRADVEAAAHAVPIFNVFREDEPCDWFTATEALSNAPRQGQQSFHRHQSCGMTKRDLPALSIIELRDFLRRGEISPREILASAGGANQRH